MLRPNCSSAQPQGGPGPVLCPKAPLAWVDRLVPHHILTACLRDAVSLQPFVTPCLCPYLLWRRSLLQHRKHSLAFALCSPLLLPVWTSLHPHRTRPLFQLRTHSSPASFHGSPVPRPCHYTASAQMLKMAFLQHPPQLPITSACLSPYCVPSAGAQEIPILLWLSTTCNSLYPIRTPLLEYWGHSAPTVSAAPITVHI